MSVENGEWVMYGVAENDPYRIKSPEELIDYVNDVGFLPLFRNRVPGFSLEERTVPYCWWTGDPENDPWEWREIIARSGELVYGKFFDKKAGFISLEWFPEFVNWRRDGYDFDALYDDGKTSFRKKKIMDIFEEKDEWFSFAAKIKAGFGKGGEKNFEGLVTELEMQTYLVLKDFRARRNKAGQEYGWHIGVLARPESIWGYDAVCSAYCRDPELSRQKIYEHMHDIYPVATEAQIDSILKYKAPLK